jgi:hypothetical protein
LQDSPTEAVPVRQLELIAVLRGVTLHTLVEHAIEQFLTNYQVLLHSIEFSAQYIERHGQPTYLPASVRFAQVAVQRRQVVICSYCPFQAGFDQHAGGRPATAEGSAVA